MAALKDMFNPETIESIATEISRVHRPFPKAKFLGLVRPGLGKLELKERVVKTAEALRECLPEKYEDAVSILVRALAPAPPEDESQDEGEDKTQSQSGVRGFMVWPFTHFVQVYGIASLEPSLKALEEMTQRFTAEFALRPFLTHEPEATLAILRRWAVHRSHHVRRAASESTRPLLPWGERLQAFRKDPRHGLKVLELLKHDSSEYVRRSVANHLNDIAKDHPKIVAETLERWLAEAPPENLENVRKIARHACRTLLKKGDARALALFGYSLKPKLEVREFRLGRKKVNIGSELPFSFEIVSLSAKKQKLMIDYAVHHMKANGRQTFKVFKLCTRDLGPKGRFEINCRHSFKEITTRKYHSGEHAIEILVNGVSLGKNEFRLTKT